MNHEILLVGEKVIVITEAVQGPPGPSSGDSGSGGVASYVADTSIGGHRVVALNAQGHAIYADSADLTQLLRIAGVTTGAADQGSAVSVVGNGPITEPSWNWDTTKPVYLGNNGLLTQQAPTLPGSKFLVVVGFPISSTSLFVKIREPFILS